MTPTIETPIIELARADTKYENSLLRSASSTQSTEETPATPTGAHFTFTSDGLTNLAQLPRDTFCVICAFSLFTDIDSVTSTSEVCRSIFTRRDARKIANERWPQRDLELWHATHPYFEFTSALWRERLVVRCELGQLIKSSSSCPRGSIEWYEEAETVVDFIQENDMYDMYMLEGLRWLNEMFDATPDRRTYDCPAVPHDFLDALGDGLLKICTTLYYHSAASERPFDPVPMLMCIVKAVGVLAHNDQNRQYMGECAILPNIIKLYQTPDCDNDLLNNILWSLVLCARPLGGVEGESYDEVANSFANTELMGQITGHKDMGVMSRLVAHQEDPVVLAKFFWLFVNFSLVNDIKDYLACNLTWTV